MLIKKLRKGVAMIELIFALVIMGIVLMSAPMLVAQATKSSLVLLEQEAISAGSANIGMILTKHWDEADTNESINGPILITNSPVPMFDSMVENNISLGRRAGTPRESSRTFFNSSLPTDLNASTLLAIDANDLNNTKDDIDDYNNWETNITSLSGGDDDYKDSLTLRTTVSYIRDNNITTTADSLSFNNPFTTSAPAGTSNIKLISINITSANPSVGTDIILNAFSCNIGTYQLERRSF